MSNVPRLKGFNDLYGTELEAFKTMESTARLIFSRYGYAEIRPPIVESTSLFQRGIGEETDVVQKEMFTFKDRKHRTISLRPEATAGVIRAAIDLGLAKPGQIARLFTTGPMFRYERPQKGRQRQFHQINCECLGSDSPFADAELIIMLLHYLQSFDLHSLSLKINSLGCPACRPAYLSALMSYLEQQEKDAFCEDCQRRMDSNPLRVLDCKICQPLLHSAPKLKDMLCVACQAHFNTVLDLLGKSGVQWVIDDHLVRGLDYYTKTTFEVVSNNIGSQTAVAGGGRYDGLVSQLGGADVPGVGFACGMERLALLLNARDNAPLDFFIISFDETGRSTAFTLAQKLRAQGFSGEMNYQTASMKSLMRQASRARARYVIILGSDELACGNISLKNMETGEQTQLPLADTPRALQKQD